jgi:2-polyprenyl-3-methyl-5-hydroxy-6-metoxy-1,4-benzoquinol methylase
LLGNPNHEAPAEKAELLFTSESVTGDHVDGIRDQEGKHMHEASLLQEAEFFDRWASEDAKHLEIVDPLVLERYRRPGRLYPKEYCFQLLGDLREMNILDVGCGGGEDGMILAKLGAKVTGLDVSPGAIELAKQRAALNGVSDRTTFVCAPLSAAQLPEKSFDVIWIDNVLHHVLGDLEGTMRALLKAARPGALIVCSEPINLNKTLRKIRFLVPVHTEVTPGERPLERPDLAVLEKLIPGLKRQHFHFLGRLTRFIVPGFRYERAAFWRRKLSDLIHLFDRFALAVPFVEELGGVGILYGRASPG